VNQKSKKSKLKSQKDTVGPSLVFEFLILTFGLMPSPSLLPPSSPGNRAPDKQGYHCATRSDEDAIQVESSDAVVPKITGDITADHSPDDADDHGNDAAAGIAAGSKCFCDGACDKA
jgi:hypothetical protein